jgi:hypothetical protein
VILSFSSLPLFSLFFSPSSPLFSLLPNHTYFLTTFPNHTFSLFNATLISQKTITPECSLPITACHVRSP